MLDKYIKIPSIDLIVGIPLVVIAIFLKKSPLIRFASGTAGAFLVGNWFMDMHKIKPLLDENNRIDPDVPGQWQNAVGF